MAKKEKKSFEFKLYVVRKAIKDKNITILCSNFLYLLTFLLRSLVLRIIPKKTVMYFIRKSVHFEPIENFSTVLSFQLINEYCSDIDIYAQRRCNENPHMIYEKYSQELKSRFNSGSFACTLIDKNKIISIFFATNRPIYIEDLNCNYKPEKYEVCITDIYTFKEYRNKGLYNMLLKYAINYYCQMGIRTLVMWIMKRNVATRKAQMKAGFNEVFQKTCHFTFLGFQKTFSTKMDSSLKDL